jgi:uncharacterized membrane protein
MDDFDRIWYRNRFASIIGGIIGVSLIGMALWVIILGVVWLTRTIL